MISTNACLSKNSCPLCRSPIKVKLQICNKDEDLYRTHCVSSHCPNINLGLGRRPVSDEESDDDDSSSDDDSYFEMPELEEVNSDQNDSEVVYFDENQFTGIAELFANYDTNNPDHPMHGLFDEDRLANEAIVNTWANSETSDDSDDSDNSDDSDDSDGPRRRLRLRLNRR